MSDKGQAKRDARETFDSIRKRIVGDNISIEQLVVAMYHEVIKNQKLTIEAINEQARGESNDAEYYIKYNKVFRGLVDTHLKDLGLPALDVILSHFNRHEEGYLLASGIDPWKLHDLMMVA